MGKCTYELLDLGIFNYVGECKTFSYLIIRSTALSYAIVLFSDRYSGDDTELGVVSP